jgi:hypothetical protein
MFSCRIQRAYFAVTSSVNDILPGTIIVIKTCPQCGHFTTLSLMPLFRAQSAPSSKVMLLPLFRQAADCG